MRYPRELIHFCPDSQTPFDMETIMIKPRTATDVPADSPHMNGTLNPRAGTEHASKINANMIAYLIV